MLTAGYRILIYLLVLRHRFREQNQGLLLAFDNAQTAANLCFGNERCLNLVAPGWLQHKQLRGNQPEGEFG